MRIPCSVPILTLNRLTELRLLLPLLVERFDDVFLIDGSSTDGTAEYARLLGLRVEPQFDDNLSRPIRDFAAMRHRSWAMAKHSWIFWIDSDELPTPELLDHIQTAVSENDPKQAHRFVRVPQLPDGRTVRHGFYFPERMIRLFHRDSGLRLVDRRVHEKFIVPDGVRMTDHEALLLAPWPAPKDMWPRQRHYLDLDALETVPTWTYLLRWIWLYNMRSLVGQVLRAVRSSLRAMALEEIALPWSYNWLFFKYRLLRMVIGTKTWTVRRYLRTSDER